MLNLRKFQVVIPIAALVLSAIACGSSNKGEKVGTSAPAETEAPVATSAPAETTAPKKSVFTVGDVISLEDHTIVVNSIEYVGSNIKANILVENTGNSDLNVSSMMSFSAKMDDGTKLEQEIFDCGSSLDGSVLPGDRLLGDICYSIPASGLFKLYYQPNPFADGAVVWEFDTNNLPAAATVPTPNANNAAKTFEIGEIVNMGGQTIVLNSAEIANNVLKANFTVENTGSEDVNVSSIMSFSAKGPDGTKLEMEIFDCGSSMDGSVLPGDKLKGDVCFDTNGASPVKLYYSASMLSSGAAVWEVK